MFAYFSGSATGHHFYLSYTYIRFILTIPMIRFMLTIPILLAIDFRLKELSHVLP